MPTALPSPRPTALTLGQSVRFFWLLCRSRWLCYRLEAAHRRRNRNASDAAGDALLLAAERWLACHEEVGALLKAPLPQAIKEMREVLQAPIQKR